MADLDRVRRWGLALIALHLDSGEWSFGFDSAKRRAGVTNFTVRRITVSRYLAARFGDDEIHQVILHEVAHALAGADAGHGPVWRAFASELGYVGERTHDGAIADELAPWVGVCPGGHRHYRYRSPVRALSCGSCGRGFDAGHLILWQKRAISRAVRRRARAGGSI